MKPDKSEIVIYVYEGLAVNRRQILTGLRHGHPRKRGPHKQGRGRGKGPPRVRQVPKTARRLTDRGRKGVYRSTGGNAEEDRGADGKIIIKKFLRWVALIIFIKIGCKS